MGISAYCMIIMADGTTKRAEDIAEADMVFCPLHGGGIAIARALHSPGVGMVALASGNLRIDITGDHLVLTDGGFMPAHQIKPGAKLQTSSGLMECTEAGPLAGDYMVYDFAMDTDAPSAYANGFILRLDAMRR